MSRTLPQRASLEFLTKQAKDFLKDVKAGDAIARERLRAFGPAGAGARPNLSDCQHALAREYGFPSWPKLKAHVQTLGVTNPTEAFAVALKIGDTARVREILRRHPEVKARLDEAAPGAAFGATPLIVAVGHGDRELVDVLLDAGANINQRSHWWAGGFHVLEHDHGLADFLIARGAVLDAKSAAGLGRLDELKALVDGDPASVRMRGGDGQTPLHVAPTIAIAEYLLDHGAEIDALDVDHESTPAQYLVRSHPDVARFLVSRGARTDILLAAALGDLERVRGFLDDAPESVRTTVSEAYFPKHNPRAGGHIYIWTLGPGKTAHTVAREFGHEDVLRLLLERSPQSLRLALACELGDEATFAVLLRARPDLAQTLNEDERRKLPFAAQNHNMEAVRMMLAAGWPVAATGQHGATALHWAAFHGDTEMTRLILSYHPPLEALDRAYRQTPLGWTIHGSLNGWHREKGDYGVVLELLLDAGAILPRNTLERDASPEVRLVLRRRASRADQDMRRSQ